MPYINASTDNPLGWKPWQTRLAALDGGLGQLSPHVKSFLHAPENYVPVATSPFLSGTQRRGKASRASLAFMGDQAGDEHAAETSYFNLIGQAQTANRRIIALENAIAQDRALAQAIGMSVLQARNDYNSKVREPLTAGYRMLFGSVPSGLAQLDPASIATVLAIAAAVGIALALLFRTLDTLEARAAATKQQSATAQTALTSATQLDQLAQDAYARGDKSTGDGYAQQAAQLRANSGLQPSGSFLTWLQDNWVWPVLAIGGTYLAGKVLD